MAKKIGKVKRVTLNSKPLKHSGEIHITLNQTTPGGMIAEDFGRPLTKMERQAEHNFQQLFQNRTMPQGDDKAGVLAMFYRGVSLGREVQAETMEPGIKGLHADLDAAIDALKAAMTMFPNLMRGSVVEAVANKYEARKCQP